MKASKPLTVLIVASTALISAATTAFAASSDRDGDGVSTAEERALGTNPNASTSARIFKNRVLSVKRGRLVVYVSKQKRIAGLVDQESEVYCKDSNYFLDEEEPVEYEEDEDGEGDSQYGDSPYQPPYSNQPSQQEEDDEPEEEVGQICTSSVLKPGMKLDEFAVSTFRGQIYFDEVLVH